MVSVQGHAALSATPEFSSSSNAPPGSQLTRPHWRAVVGLQRHLTSAQQGRASIAISPRGCGMCCSQARPWNNFIAVNQGLVGRDAGAVDASTRHDGRNLASVRIAPRRTMPVVPGEEVFIQELLPVSDDSSVQPMAGRFRFSDRPVDRDQVVSTSGSLQRGFQTSPDSGAQSDNRKAMEASAWRWRSVRGL